MTPTKVTSLTEYAEKYSTAGAKAGVVNLPTENNNSLEDPMGHAVRGFFMNGGMNAYIVSLSNGTETTSSGILLMTGTAVQEYAITARSAGAWGNDVTVTVSTSSRGQDFCDVEIAAVYSLGGTETSTLTERFVGQAAGALDTIQSSLVTFAPVATSGNEDFTLDVSAPAPPDATDNHTLSGGTDGPASAVGMGAVFEALADFDDISLIVMPGQVWQNHQANYETAIAHCQAMKDRMVLIQLNIPTTDFGNIGVPFDKYAAVYYPTASVTLPVPGGGTLDQVTGMTGHVAGVFARTDGELGPWTAPAGMHASIAGITQLTEDISQTRQGSINPENVNAARYIEGVPVVWGARTRDQGGIYEYVPVMRTAFLIADSLRTALNRAVFAKNTEVLWKNVKAGVTGFMDTLYNQGAFQGATPSQAFEVAVGLGESMTQADIDSGLLRVTVRFRPAKPAEMIEVSVEQLFEAA